VTEKMTGAAEAPQCEKGPSIFGEVELSWRVKFEGDLAGVLQSQRQFISDVIELCGEDAVTWKLCQGPGEEEELQQRKQVRVYTTHALLIHEVRVYTTHSFHPLAHLACPISILPLSVFRGGQGRRH
jgi:hypothetical protein